MLSCEKCRSMFEILLRNGKYGVTTRPDFAFICPLKSQRRNMRRRPESMSTDSIPPGASGAAMARESAIAFLRAARCSGVSVELRRWRICRSSTTSACRKEKRVSDCPNTNAPSPIFKLSCGNFASPLYRRSDPPIEASRNRRRSVSAGESSLSLSIAKFIPKGFISVVSADERRLTVPAPAFMPRASSCIPSALADMVSILTDRVSNESIFWLLSLTNTLFEPKSTTAWRANRLPMPGASTIRLRISSSAGGNSPCRGR